VAHRHAGKDRREIIKAMLLAMPKGGHLDDSPDGPEPRRRIQGVDRSKIPDNGREADR